MDLHVGRSIEWLKNRLKLVREREGFIQGSTSFPDIETANKYTRETLLRNAAGVEKWLAENKLDSKAFTAEFTENVGYGFNKNGQYFESIKTVKVVLVKNDNGYSVLTSHPLVEKVK